MVEEHDVAIPMRDGVRLLADVFRPIHPERYPALVALQPWGKDREELGRRFPTQRRPSPLWDGALAGGDTSR